MSKTKNKLGQYFTPKHIAEFMVNNFVTQPKNKNILEPSSGEGVFLDVLHEQGYLNTIGVEIDSELAKLRKNVINSSFVTWEPEADQKFSVIIGNPPYIRWKDLDEENKTDLQKTKYWGETLTYLTDFLNIFIIKSIDLLEDGGELIFITPKFWMNTLSSQTMRDWILSRGYFESIVDFEESAVFPGVASHIVIFKFVKKKVSDGNPNIDYFKVKSRLKIKESVTLNDFTKTSIPPFTKSNTWTYIKEDALKKLNDFEAQCVIPGKNTPAILKDYIDGANGLVSGLDEAFKLEEFQLKALNKEESKRVIEVVKAKNMERFRTTNLSYYFLLLPGDIDEEREFLTNFPNFAKKLSPYKTRLEKRHTYADHLNYWEWAFLRSKDFHLNDKDKIMVPVKERLTHREFVRFTLTPKKAIATQDAFSFTTLDTTKESLQYVSVFLTLPIVTEWVRSKGLMKGGIAEFGAAGINKIPFKPINWTDEKEIKIYKEIIQMVDDNVELNKIHLTFNKLLNS